jgi:hypothetical protein
MEQPTAPVLGRRRGPRWTRVSHGLHRPADLASDLSGWRLVLPASGRFTHLTGAGLHGWWLPPLPEGLPVFAAIADAESRPQRRGLRVARHPAVAEPVDFGGLPCDSAPEVLLACSRDLGLLDVVVLIDAALHLGSCSTDELMRVAAQRRRGAPRLRQALTLADGRSESPWETLLRLLHHSCDVPVEPQWELFDGEVLVARADLWVRGTNALHEYDGEAHLTRRRQRKDLARARRIGNHTWIRRGYTSVEVLHQAVGILRDADLSLGREHRPGRIRAWHALLADSLFTPSGRERLVRRLNLAPAATGGERQRGSA